MTNKLTPLAKDLRTNSTDAERYLWKHIRAKRLDGYKFRRQEPIENYIVDFICLEKRLIVELDGGHHSEKKIALKDNNREQVLNDNDFRILRFWNNDVLQNIDNVLETIREALEAPSPQSPPVKGGEAKK